MDRQNALKYNLEPPSLAPAPADLLPLVDCGSHFLAYLDGVEGPVAVSSMFSPRGSNVMVMQGDRKTSAPICVKLGSRAAQSRWATQTKSPAALSVDPYFDCQEDPSLNLEAATRWFPLMRSREKLVQGTCAHKVRSHLAAARRVQGFEVARARAAARRCTSGFSRIA